MDLENFATASRPYTGDIHKSSGVGLFMTHLRQWKRLGRVMVDCTLFITHCLRLNLQLHTISLVRTCRISSFCTERGSWQDYYWQDASHGHSAIAELLVNFPYIFFQWESANAHGKRNSSTFTPWYRLPRSLHRGNFCRASKSHSYNICRAYKKSFCPSVCPSAKLHWNSNKDVFCKAAVD